MFLEFFKTEDHANLEKTRLGEYLGVQPRTKSLAWKQENEWRMLWQNDETRLKFHRVEIPQNAITAVYIGMTASNKFEDDVKFESNRRFPNAKVFRAVKKQGFSELKFIQVGGP
jgi:hypothetical protein